MSLFITRLKSILSHVDVTHLRTDLENLQLGLGKSGLRLSQRLGSRERAEGAVGVEDPRRSSGGRDLEPFDLGSSQVDLTRDVTCNLGQTGERQTLTSMTLPSTMAWLSFLRA